MSFKPSISFTNTTSNSALVTKVNIIIVAMTDNSNYPEQKSGIGYVITLNNAFQIFLCVEN